MSADGITLNVGAGGSTVRTDNVGGFQYQVVKLSYGDYGSNTLVDDIDGLPIQPSEQVRDAFNRLRTSNPLTLFYNYQLSGKDTINFDESITNGSTNATSTYTKPYVDMYVENTDTIIRQTYQRFGYQPGKSQLFLFTGVMGGGTGVISRYGAFDTDNGCFFELDDTVMKVVIRNNTTDTAVASGSWNLDPMDGTGPSEVTLDSTKAQIFVIDYSWLSVGRVRFGFMIGGEITYVHEFLHANVNTTPYMETPNLPIRAEISSTGASATFRHICCSVMSEGGQEASKDSHIVSTGNTHLDADAEGTLYALIGLRLKATDLDRIIKILKVSVLATTTDAFEWSLVVDPTVAGTFSYSAEPNTPVEVALGDTTNTITNGIAIDGGFVSSGESPSIPSSERWLGSAIDGTPQEYVLCVRPLGANADVHGLMQFTI